MSGNMSDVWRNIYGDITSIRSPDVIILQANNCLCTKPHGLSSDLYKSYPYCRVYVDRKNVDEGATNLAIPAHRPEPGEIRVYESPDGDYPLIVALYCCYDFGKPGHKFGRPHHFMVDSEKHRLLWLSVCLRRLGQIFPSGSQFAIPYKMLCGRGGLHWSDVLLLLQHWAVDYSYIITCYHWI